MRRRVVRDLGTLLGVVVVLVVVWLINDYMRRGTMTDQYEKVRRTAEADQKSQGTDLLSWDLLRKTKGTVHSGPTFVSELLGLKDKAVDLVGFMVPLYEFRGVTEFLLLPLPIECYFCQAPPMRDVMLVQMAANTTTDIVKEPVMISGALTLNEGAGTKFFYVIKDAARNAGERGGKLHKKAFTQEHVVHATGAKQAEEAAKEPLLPGHEPPKTPAAPAPAPPAVPQPKP